MTNDDYLKAFEEEYGSGYFEGYEDCRHDLEDRFNAIEGKVRHLEAELERVGAERDALFADLKSLEHCEVCKHNKTKIFDEPCKNCGGRMWEWRGVQPLREVEK